MDNILVLMCAIFFVSALIFGLLYVFEFAELRRAKRNLEADNMQLIGRVAQLQSDVKKPRSEDLIDVLAEMRKNGVLIEVQVIDKDNVFYHPRQE